MDYDVIIVGARCAGATLATLLARSGVKTLMLDAQPMPSDMPLSTHFIQAPGMDVLDEIGVGEAIRACTPATRRLLMRVEQHEVLFDRSHKASVPHVCRRSVVDPLIQAAAIRAGADLRDRTRVSELLRDGERVSGVVVETPNGRETLRAPLIVGADGRNSTIARLTGAEEYLSFPMTRSGYWFYFPTPTIWRDDARYAGCDGYMGYQGDGLRYVFQCDGDVLLMLASPPAAEMQGWNGAYSSGTLDYLRQDEFVRPLVEASRPTGKGNGLLKAHFFYRRPVGPGFALIGDAGNFKDYTAGYGMTDAFLSAKMLHKAILAGTDAAYQRYWRERDADTLPLYFEALRLGEVGVNDAFTRLLFQNLGRSPQLAARLVSVFDRELSPLDAFSTGELLRMVGSALLRGRFEVLRPFLKLGKRMGAFRKEVASRMELLEQLTPEGSRAAAGPVHFGARAQV